jgi:hypothetical protein
MSHRHLLALSLCRRLACVAAALLLPWHTAMAQGPAAPENKQDFSAAERLLLMSDQLHMVKPPMTLSYSYRKSGSLEPGFTDSVTLKLVRLPDGKCCQVSGDFLTGERRTPLPEVEQAQGNPVILFFLERDIREMQRLTKGSTVYFRKRIRMALYDSAKVLEAHYTYRGKPVTGKDVVISPYQDDPNRAKFEKLTGKQYVFSLSDEVPGGVVAIRTLIATASGAEPLLEEELLLAQASTPGRVATQAAATPSGKAP